METAIIALIGTVLGGAGLKIIEHVLNRGKVKEDVATNLREELRADLKAAKEEIRLEAAAADKWQTAYWELKAELSIVNHKTNKAIEAIEKNHESLDLDNLEYPGGRLHT